MLVKFAPLSIDCRQAIPSSYTTQRLIAALLLGVSVFAINRPLLAQDVVVVTKVSHREPTDGRLQLLSRSLTLFHGGKAYDYVEEVGEVVIHEPAQSQFVILSLNGNKMAARVRYEELLNFQKVARAETIKYMEELSSQPQSTNANAIQALRFQLDPQFGEQFDASKGRLTLSSQFVSYAAETAKVERPGVVEQYLEWADWTARLNSVLHPQAAVTPEARVALNKALREHARIPTQVDLTISIEGETRLRAEHTYMWSLRSFDRDSIAKWEQTRNADDLRWVDLREYQRILVAAANRRGR